MSVDDGGAAAGAAVSRSHSLGCWVINLSRAYSRVGRREWQGQSPCVQGLITCL